jgi:hypothetical protein
VLAIIQIQLGVDGSTWHTVLFEMLLDDSNGNAESPDLNPGIPQQ